MASSICSSSCRCSAVNKSSSCGESPGRPVIAELASALSQASMRSEHSCGVRNCSTTSVRGAVDRRRGEIMGCFFMSSVARAVCSHRDTGSMWCERSLTSITAKHAASFRLDRAVQLSPSPLSQPTEANLAVHPCNSISRLSLAMRPPSVSVHSHACASFSPVEPLTMHACATAATLSLTSSLLSALHQPPTAHLALCPWTRSPIIVESQASPHVVSSGRHALLCCGRLPS